MQLPDPYPVQPWTRPCVGEVTLPGSKSLTNRLLILSALADGRVRLQGALFSRDSTILCNALQSLGFTVRTDEQSAVIEIEGQAGRIPAASASMHVGNAGTAARFLTAFVCLHPNGCFDFDGDPEMRVRPMRGLIDALQRLGARFTFHQNEGCFPFTVQTCGLRAGVWYVDADASSQMLSALLLVSPFAGAAVTIRSKGVRPAFVRMTAQWMTDFGASLNCADLDSIGVEPSLAYHAPALDVEVEPDVSAASYFLALPMVVGGDLLIRGLRSGMSQGDLQFAEVLQQLGLNIEQRKHGWLVSRGPTSTEVEDLSFDFNSFSDTFLTLAAIAPALHQRILIKGIGHTRHQETDRIHAVTTELRRIGIPAVQFPDSMLIPRADIHSIVFNAPVTVQTYHDHRVAMAFAILGCLQQNVNRDPWMLIADPACCSKTFPQFFQVLSSLYRISHDK